LNNSLGTCEIVGIGELRVATSELRACYVSPDATRKGVGSAIIREIERIAVQSNVGIRQELRDKLCAKLV
jgi:putative acetyltransferase